MAQTPAKTMIERAIANLEVTHRLLPVTSDAQETHDFSATFRLHTCQRSVTMTSGIGLAVPAPGSRTEIYRGMTAYRFLLELATGLQSAIPGETNVFGQFRSAWSDYLLRGGSAQLRGLTPVIEALFDDTRFIRTHFLQGIGGNSYGTLTRRLLRPAPRDRVLVVGFGDLAKSVLPMFREFELGLINRTPLRTFSADIDRLFAPAEVADAAAWADHVVLCVPRHPGIDAEWITVLATHARVRVAHLGCRRADAGPWARLPRLVTLDDLFELRDQQAERRTRQLTQARSSCDLHARLRAAGAPVPRHPNANFATK